MTAATHNRFLAPAWIVSVTLHGVVVTLAMLFAAQVRPVFQEEPFKWDVALIETMKTDSPAEAMPQPAAEPMRPSVRPMQPQVRSAPAPVEPPPDSVMHRVAPQQTVQMVHPEVPPVKPVEREEPPPPLKTERMTPPVTPVPDKTIEPVEQKIVETPKTQPEPPSPPKEPEPVQSSEPVIAQRQPVAPPPSEAVETRPIENPAKPSRPEPASLAPAETVAPAARQEAPMQTAKAAQSGPEVKTDHRWLAESLWRRVAELKRYPNSARLNGQEGKVILKAVIRSDGHLIDVTVQKSSGHQILDAAAVEAVKLACPLHMKHAINKPEIVVSLPIVYSLAN
jgi:periplasmic protein TonB